MTGNPVTGTVTSAADRVALGDLRNGPFGKEGVDQGGALGTFQASAEQRAFARSNPRPLEICLDDEASNARIRNETES